jgi:hypothetical protein
MVGGEELLRLQALRRDSTDTGGARDVSSGRFMPPGGGVLLEPLLRLDAALGHEADVVDFDQE